MFPLFKALLSSLRAKFEHKLIQLILNSRFKIIYESLTKVPPLACSQVVKSTPYTTQKPQASQLQVLLKPQSPFSCFSKSKFEFITFTHFLEPQPVQALKLQTSTLFFSQESLFLEADMLKDCRFYELIPLDTKSARMEHIKDDQRKLILMILISLLSANLNSNSRRNSISISIVILIKFNDI
ncbi:hypothetical protein Cgig2_032168 [Carnegiea gigantea]|uniref:Uncharacterized protein n=1 Tax=Carnegiea gigantea TaxID=171969 RepID=A0A9Q1K8W3_9CARY|nr:hypothetical protein Cgig2_032168 [Carnegiea gigantea]